MPDPVEVKGIRLSRPKITFQAIPLYDSKEALSSSKIANALDGVISIKFSARSFSITGFGAKENIESWLSSAQTSVCFIFAAASVCIGKGVYVCTSAEAAILLPHCSPALPASPAPVPKAPGGIPASLAT